MDAMVPLCMLVIQHCSRRVPGLGLSAAYVRSNNYHACSLLYSTLNQLIYAVHLLYLAGGGGGVWGFFVCFVFFAKFLGVYDENYQSPTENKNTTHLHLYTCLDNNEMLKGLCSADASNT